MYQCKYAVEVWQWMGNGFSLFKAYCPYLCDSVVIQTESSPERGAILIYKPETKLIREKATRLYELRDKKWVWIIPLEETQTPTPPEPPTFRAEITSLLFRARDARAALERLDTAIPQTADELASILYLQAIAYHQLGETDYANTLWNRILRVAPNTAWAQRAREHLERGW